MNESVRLPSGKLLPQCTAKTAKNKSEIPEDARLTALLARIGSHLRDDLRAIRQQPAKTGYANPRDWAVSSFYLIARSVLDGELACLAAEVPIASLTDLGSEAAVQAIVARFKTSAGSGHNARRILTGLRTVVRCAGCNPTRAMGKAIRELARTARRGEDEDLPDPASCLTAALAEFEDAVAMMADGQRRRGKTRLRDAVLMAVDIGTGFRRGELAAITVEVIFVSDYRCEVEIIIDEAASKVREVQLGVIRDNRVIGMLRRLIADTGSGNLFKTNAKKPLAPTDCYRALRRTSERSLGIRLNFNHMRRIRVTGETNLGAMRATARHHADSTMPETTYSWHADDIGIDKCRAVVREFGLPSGLT